MSTPGAHDGLTFTGLSESLEEVDEELPAVLRDFWMAVYLLDERSVRSSV